MLAIVTGSMPVKGSSSRMIFGSETKQRAISSPAAFAAGQRHGFTASEFGDAELLQQLVAASTSILAFHAEHFHDAQQIVLHRELAKDTRLLREVAHAAFARPAMHGPIGHVSTAEPYLPGVGLGHSASHAKGGCLASSIGS